MLECGERASELTSNLRRTEIEAFKHQRNGIALIGQCSFYLATQPIGRIVAMLQRGGGEQDKKMCPRFYVSEYDGLEVATGDTAEINEYVIAMLGQVLKNGKRPRNVGAAITDENGFFDAFHTADRSREHRKWNDTRNHPSPPQPRIRGYSLQTSLLNL